MNTATSTALHEGTMELAPREEAATARPTSLVTTTPTPADLLAMAMSNGADLDQLERLMALQERWEANQAEKAFVAAMTAFKAEPIEILKRKRVYFQSQKGTTDYYHAELADVVDAAIVGMAKHGLSHAWEPEQKPNGTVEVTCIVTHAQGHSKRTTLMAAPDNTGNKNAIQQVSSTITYLQRYTLLMALGLATKGMDDDGRGGAKPGQPPAGSGSDIGADEARDAVVSGLYAEAEKGTAALLKAWGTLPERERTRVGIQFKDIKARAQQVGP
jgi:hypothetical protein